MSFKCGICLKSFDDSLKNEHHRIPQAFGGDDSPSNKRFLCAGCHQTLHRLAEHYLNPHKAGLVPGIARAYCKEVSEFPEKSVSVLIDLAKCAYEYELKVNRGQLKINPWSEKTVTVIIPAIFKNAFELACKRRQVFGKKGSMQTVLEDAILKVTGSAFPNLKPEIVKYLQYKSRRNN